MSDIGIRKTLVVNQSLATSSQFTVNVSQNITFVPKYVIVRQLLYTNIAGGDNGTYLLRSDMSSAPYWGAIYTGIQSVGLEPQTIIALQTCPAQITFTLVPANTAFTGPTGQVTMVLEVVA
jgi:hypothetical protein